MAHGGRETEIKLSVPDAADARRRVRAARFRIWRRRVFEANTVYDTPDAALRGGAQLLRIREAGRLVTLTYKGPPDVGRHKSREELEIVLPDAKTLPLIFERLGFRPAFRYEKYRTEYRRPGAAGVATLDETPIGVYLELEGAPAWIDHTAKQLGFKDSDYITGSYARLYLDWCAARGVEPTNMVFARRDRGN